MPMFFSPAAFFSQYFLHPGLEGLPRRIVASGEGQRGNLRIRNRQLGALHPTASPAPRNPAGSRPCADRRRIRAPRARLSASASRRRDNRRPSPAPGESPSRSPATESILPAARAGVPPSLRRNSDRTVGFAQPLVMLSSAAHTRVPSSTRHLRLNLHQRIEAVRRLHRLVQQIQRAFVLDSDSSSPSPSPSRPFSDPKV